LYSVPKDAIQKGFLHELIRKEPSLGVVCNSNGSDQIAYEIVKDIEYNFPLGNDFSFFCNSIPKFFTTVPFAVFHTYCLADYSGDLIAMEVNDVFDAKRCAGLNKLVFYVRDLCMINKLNRDYFCEIMSDSKVIKVFASEMYLKMALEIFSDVPFSNVSKKYMEKFDYQKILSILNED